ncbi:MAG: hypothetical protein HY852_21020 [Bradyrhizobium sp.]|uniref:hypothetical protein n=1 Tax=Bradyrhizobium sp. TaxID=376 RepID=UPI0025BC89D9|nr:hypothetical protein [Bradyrhizobium sp.]MBI5264292.1 hypothetical protein [Bradyrhizobium sp.]
MLKGVAARPSRHVQNRKRLENGEMKRRTRPGEGNEGVGEHVRTKSHLGRKAAGEIAEPWWGSAANEENLFLLPDRKPGERSSARQIVIRPLT